MKQNSPLNLRKKVNNETLCTKYRVFGKPIGLVVHLEGQTIILPQDCIYTSEIFGPPAKMSGFMYDSVSFLKSIEKVRNLAKKYNAKIFPAHDWEFFQTMKLAPKYYE